MNTVDPSGDPASGAQTGDEGAEAAQSPAYLVLDEFLTIAPSLRAEFEAHFSQPHQRFGSRQEIWDYWYVPDMYTYLRTDPGRLFSAQGVEGFLQELSAWTFRNLGLSQVSRPYLSLYVNGCSQGLHNDSENGRFAYVFSLTDWGRRRFTGGETVLLKDQPYWGSPRISAFGAGNDFCDLIPNLFNRLLIFDDRVVHGVRPVQGSMDPRECRVVLHGHITEGGSVVEGALSRDEVASRISGACTPLLSDITDGELYHGFFTVRMEIAANGSVSSTRVLCNRVLPISARAAGRSAIVRLLVERLSTVTFSPQSARTVLTLPVVL